MVISVAGNNKTYSDLHLECLIFLSDFSQIWILQIDCHISPQHQVSQKSVKWEPL
jgi:hypothetical protein